MGAHGRAGREILLHFATAISERLEITVEGRVHNKHGRPDHVHLLLGTRVVHDGRIGRKCRSLDAVSEKAAGRGIRVGTDRQVGPTCEWMRELWAGLTREANGDAEIDHRSYARRGLSLRPVTHVARADIEWEKRPGHEDWRERRRREIATRAPDGPDDVAVEMPEQTQTARDGSPAPSVESAPTAVKEVRRRATAILQAFGFLPDTAPIHSDLQAMGIDALFGLGADDIAGIASLALIRRQGVIAASTHPEPSASTVGNGRFDGPAKDPDALRAKQSTSDLQPAVPPHCVGIADPVMQACLLHARLKEQHRSTKPRTEALGAAVGLDPDQFEARTAALVDTGPDAVRFDPTSPQVPPDLAALWRAWQIEDNEARNARRKATRSRRSRDEGQPDSMPVPIAPEAGHQAIPVPQDEPPAVVTTTNPMPKTDVGVDADVIAVRPETVDKASPLLMNSAFWFGRDTRPNECPADLVERELYKVFEHDARSTARRSGKPLSNEGHAEFQIALRLRAAGRAKLEVEDFLRVQCPPSDHAERTRRIDHAVAMAFSAPSTAHIEKNGFERRIRDLEIRTEARIYRHLRATALASLKSDLDAVWRERRFQAEEAWQRHRDRERTLFALQWRTRRMGRAGPVFAVLSLMIQLAVLRPLLAHSQDRLDREQQAIRDAAQAAEERLRALHGRRRSRLK